MSFCYQYCEQSTVRCKNATKIITVKHATQLYSCQNKAWKKFRLARMRSLTSAILVQRSNQLSYNLGQKC